MGLPLFLARKLLTMKSLRNLHQVISGLSLLEKTSLVADLVVGLRSELRVYR